MLKITPARVVLALFLAVGCSHEPVTEDVAAEWASVLAAKREWRDAGEARERAARQKYVDALARFIERHPGHSRGREVYEEVELEFAELLAARGDYDGAIRYYRSVLETNPEHAQAAAGLAEAERLRFVAPEALAALERGMSPADVEERLGRPLPGWSRRHLRGGTVTDSWYYRSASGEIAAVFFRDGRLFAAELGGPVRLAR